MAFFKKTTVQPVIPEEETHEETVITEQVPEERKVFTPIYQTKIGKGITFYGDFESKDPIELNGSIHGNINSSDKINISGTGSYYGNANMHELHVEGIVKGTIVCEDLAAFTETSRMDGKLTTARLRTDDGSGMAADLHIDPTLKKDAAPAKDDFPRTSFGDPTEGDTAASLSEEGDIPVTEADLFS